jgi:hypothetical protein
VIVCGCENACRILLGKPEEKRPLSRPRLRWMDSIKMDLRGMVSVGMDWTDVIQDTDQWRAYLNTVMNVRVS